MVMLEIEPKINTEITELWLHYLWRTKGLEEFDLYTEDKRKLKILSPGWYNKGWGPDFKEAKILIDDNLLFGDIEIHVEEFAWNDHQHHKDQVYNKVILHVFLQKGESRVTNQIQQTVQALHLGQKQFATLWYNYNKADKPDMQDLPGACGLYLDDKNFPKVKNLIFQASEQRLLNKSNFFLNEFEKQTPDYKLEDLLFTSICKSFGYSAYSDSFVKLSYAYPYSAIKKLFQRLYRQSRIEILSRWLGFLDILNQVNPHEVHDDLRREWTAFQQFWNQLGKKNRQQKIRPKTPSRPLNNPLRRLTGLYYHLEKVQFQGLIKSWLSFLLECEKAIEKNKKKQPTIIASLDQMFPQPDWDPLNHIIYATSKQRELTKTKLVGKQRQLVVFVNSILPFFVAWSKYNKDKNLEKTLLTLFLTLPSEGTNRKTKFMEKRLFQIHKNVTIKNNLSYYQGLIQLHDDCCRSFYEGCDNCSLVKMMRQ